MTAAAAYGPGVLPAPSPILAFADERAPVLRVAAVWGTTVLSVKLLDRGESFTWGDSEMALRAAGSAWELDARGAIGGVLRLRGREEDPAALGHSGGAVPVVPGDYGVIQYGLFSIFFQYTSPGYAVATRAVSYEALAIIAFISSTILHIGIAQLFGALSTPEPLANPFDAPHDDLAHMMEVTRDPAPQEEEKKVSGGSEKDKDKDKGSGVKDPGMKDNKPQGGSKKMAGTEGKLGGPGNAKSLQLQGEPRPTKSFGGESMADLLSSDMGAQLKKDLNFLPKSMGDVLSGTRAEKTEWTAGSGAGLRGAGSGGGGTDRGLFGGGEIGTGLTGNGSGGGTGAGGPGGVGNGGNGMGGPGGNGAGNGRGGNGNGNGAGGNGVGERGVAGNDPGASKHGLSPEQVRRVFMSRGYGMIRACYETALTTNPSLKGGITVSFTILPAGGVGGVNVNSTMGPSVTGCVKRNVGRLSFPSAEAATNASFPLVFGVGGH